MTKSHDERDKWVLRLSQSLGLNPFDQDWGIQNSDPQRLDEFLSFFESHETKHPWDFEELADLIFESANDKLLTSGMSSAEKFLLCRFVEKNFKLFPLRASYWSGLFGNAEFPVAELIHPYVAC